MNLRKVAQPFLVLVLAVHGIFAGVKGPKYYDIRAMGMGNTTVAVTTGRTAIFHNPAGLDFIGDKLEISISPITASVDGRFITLLKTMADEGWKLSDLANLDQDFIDNVLNEYDGDWVGFEYIPEVSMAAKNVGFGFYSVWPIGVRIESGHLIPKLELRGQRDVVFTWAAGVPLKSDNHHFGISIEYLQRTPVDDTITKFSDTFLYFKEVASPSALGVLSDFGSLKHGVSFDIGFIHDWNAFRLAWGVRDILGVIGGELVWPPSLDLGCAFFVPNLDKVEYIDGIILSLDLSDIAGTEPETEYWEHWPKKVHVGFEFDIHYAAFRFGLNQGYPTAGIGFRLGIFKLDYVYFTEESGFYVGQAPKKKHAISMGFGFKTNRLRRINEEAGFIPEDIKEYDMDTGKRLQLREKTTFKPLPPKDDKSSDETTDTDGISQSEDSTISKEPVQSSPVK